MIKLYDYFYVGLMVVSLAGATVFARGISNYTDYSYYFYILLSIVTLFVHKVNIFLNKSILFKVWGYFGIFSVYLFIFFNDKMTGFLAMTVPVIFHTFVIVATYKKRFIIIFEKIVVFMSFVALFFWIGNITFTNAIEYFVETYQFSESYGIGIGDDNSNVLANIIFYTLPNYSSIDYDNGVFSYILRNAGFAWEPGAFASIIILALFCNVVIKKFKFNRSLIILIIALFSSQSTTGLVLFCIFLLFYAYNQSRTKFIYLSIFFSIAIIIILTSPIVQNKFEVEYNIDPINSLSNSDAFAARRWLSFQVDFLDFLHQPFGSGMGQYTWHYTFAKDVHTISGLGKIFSYYGIFGVLAFFYYSVKSSTIISKIFNYKGKYFLFIFIFGILISYDFTLKPIFAYFWTYTLFLNNYKNKRFNTKNTITKENVYNYFKSKYSIQLKLKNV